MHVNKTLIHRAIAAGFLTTTFSFAPLNLVWAEEHETEEHCMDCGVVSAIQVSEQDGSSGLTGAAAGAVAGGVAGNQVGQTQAASSTIGSTAATILGAIGGAVGGHYVEKAVTATKTWVVTVNMDNNAGTRSLTMTTNPQVAIGDHVRISGNSLLPYKTHDD